MTRFRLLEPWRTRLLWLSLGLNVFAVTLLAVPHLRPGHPPGPPHFDTLIERLARNLQEPDAARFRDSMARERPWWELGRQKLDEARQAVGRSVGHEPFDPAAVHAALQAMQQRVVEGATRFDDSLVMALGTLSPEGRARLAEFVRRGPR